MIFFGRGTCKKLGKVFWYQKLELNLIEVKQCKKERSWKSMIRYVLSPSFDARRIRFWFEVFIAGIHVPPYLMIRHYADVQLICFLRVYQVMKFVKHHNPLKFGRVMGSITQVSPIDFHESNFMFKVFT